jgi:hypothetical protein
VRILTLPLPAALDPAGSSARVADEFVLHAIRSVCATPSSNGIGKVSEFGIRMAVIERRAGNTVRLHPSETVVAPPVTGRMSGGPTRRKFAENYVMRRGSTLLFRTAAA